MENNSRMGMFLRDNFAKYSSIDKYESTEKIYKMNNLDNNIIERLTYTQLQSAEYKQAYETLRGAYKQLVAEFTEKQLNAFEEYFNAVMETMAITEKLAYKQGIADFINTLY